MESMPEGMEWPKRHAAGEEKAGMPNAAEIGGMPRGKKRPKPHAGRKETAGKACRKGKLR